MTNQKLKNKIIDCIINTFADDKYGIGETLFIEEAEKLADALIAAGLKFDTVVSHTATFDLMQEEHINDLERRLGEYEQKVEFGELVEPVWFISFMNNLPCYGRVIGYQEDSGFVISCPDCLISAEKNIPFKGRSRRSACGGERWINTKIFIKLYAKGDLIKKIRWKL